MESDGMGLPWQDIRDSLQEAGHAVPESVRATHVGGGCIHETYRLEGAERSWFLKLGKREMNAMFAAEATGLLVMAATRTVRIPEPLAQGANATQAWLVMEHIAMRRGTPDEYAEMGRRLAAMHRETSADGSYGWPESNFIGATPQSNAWTVRWADFWREQRLRPLIERAQDKGWRCAQADRLMERVHDLLAGHEPPPALLHGDLWSGNAGFDADGVPVLYDPACYHGDRETDLAFTRMFGGFPGSFYTAYDAAWQLPEGAAQRVPLYNLYHTLNHSLLFGDPYGDEAARIIARLL